MIVNVEMKFCKMFSLGFLFLGSASLFQISWHYIQRAQAFPVILEFNAAWSNSFVHFDKTEMEPSSDKAGGNNHLFHIRFSAARFPGVSVIEPGGFYLLFFGHSMRCHDDLDRFRKTSSAAQQFTR